MIFFLFPIFYVGIEFVGVWEIFIRASVSYYFCFFCLTAFNPGPQHFSVVQFISFLPYSLDLLVEDSILFCTMISYLCGVKMAPDKTAYNFISHFCHDFFLQGGKS